MLGRYFTEARLTIYEKTVVPTMTFNMECWTKIEEKEIEKLEQIQGKILKTLLHFPLSTPTLGVLKETGIWPIREQITYQRLMLYQNVITSEEERLGKIVVKEQQKGGVNWYSETDKLARRVKIELKWAEELRKDVWKKIVKQRILEKIEKETEEKERQSKKMRHQIGQKYERKGYLRQVGVEEAGELVKRRLEMMDIGNNLGKDRRCQCGEKETTEHLIACKERMKKTEIAKEWLQETENLEIMRRVNKYIEEITKSRKE